MNGYGSHAFSLINKNNERFWVKFHFKTAQGIKNLTNSQATKLKGTDPDSAQRDLVESIDKGDFPKWNLKIQIMPEADAKTYKINPFDLTKIWPHSDYPLIDIGVMELNKNPENYFAEVEQSAFAPAHIVDGIGYSPDKMLQGRLLSYPDAHRYRIGGNYEKLPVNRCPFAINNYQRDGVMNFDGHGGSGPNYYPNSFGGPEADKNYGEPAFDVNGLADRYDRNAPGNDDHYSQPGNLFRKVMNDQDKAHTISNIIGAMKGISGQKRDEIVMRQICHFFRADKELGSKVAEGLGVDISKCPEAVK